MVSLFQIPVVRAAARSFIRGKPAPHMLLQR
jgi:hypothetical protein